MTELRGFLLDTSDRSVVWVCHDCGARGFALDRLEARRATAGHERRAHPGQLLASDTLSKQRARHAR